MKNTTFDKIMQEIAKALAFLGAKSDLLGIVNSFDETLTAKEILTELEGWNKANSKLGNKS